MLRCHLCSLLFGVLMWTGTVCQAQGIYLSAGGPINRSMGGASTAAPMDAAGAMYWNPATTSSLEPELGFGVGMLLSVLDTSSSVPGLAGSTGAEPGVTPIPNIGWVHRNPGSNLTFGLGIMSVAGVKTNYPASLTNPIFAPQSNTPGVTGGFGGLYTAASFMQIAPTVSWAVTDRLSIAFGPTVTIGDVVIDPLVVAPLNDGDANTAFLYGTGRGTRFHWGGGAQLGLYYITDRCWHLGASIKSPQWMEEFRFHSQDEVGAPLVGRFDLDLPMIVSLGTAYTGIENWIFALDVRYFDYKNTSGFREQGFAPDGRLTGLGFSSVVAVASGVQYRLADCLYLRGGYTYNQSPLRDWEATIATAAPLYYQHQFSGGFSYGLSDCVWVNMAYTYAPESDKSGLLLTPAGAVPGSSVTTTLSAHLLSFGATVKY